MFVLIPESKSNGPSTGIFDMLEIIIPQVFAYRGVQHIKYSHYIYMLISVVLCNIHIVRVALILLQSLI